MAARLLAAAGLLAASLPLGGAAAAQEPPPLPPRAPVALVVAMVPDLTWERSPSPEVRHDLREWSVGALVPATARHRVCPADMWLTIGAGARAYVPGDGCPVPTVTGGRVDDWDAIVRANEAKRFGAQPGLQGDTIGCTGATGAAAALAAADATGHVDEYSEEFGHNVRCPHQYVDLTGVGALGEAMALIDARYRATMVVLIGLPDPDEPGHYGGIAVLPEERRGGILYGSLRQDGIVLPRDLSTRTWAIGDEDEVLGEARFARLVELDRIGHLHRRYAGWYFAAVISLPLLLYIWVSVRRRAGPRARALAYVFAALPAAGFLSSAVPWWRAGASLAACVAAVAAAAVLLAVAARLLPGPTAVWLCALSAAVFVVDLVAGQRLQLTGIASYSPVNGGRFYGLGNVGFAILTTAAVVVSVWVAARRDQRVWLGGLLPVGALGALPRYGADFGSAIAVAAAFAAAAARRARRAAVVAGTVAGLALALGAAVLDYQRPAADRTHLGAFVDDLLHGGWTDTVLRKAGANLHTLTRSWYPLLLAGSLAVAVLMLRRLRAAGDDAMEPYVRPLAALWLVGSLLNDSGVMVAAFGTAVAVPLLLAYASVRLDERPW